MSLNALLGTGGVGFLPNSGSPQILLLAVVFPHSLSCPLFWVTLQFRSPPPLSASPHQEKTPASLSSG